MVKHPINPYDIARPHALRPRARGGARTGRRLDGFLRTGPRAAQSGRRLSGTAADCRRFGCGTGALFRSRHRPLECPRPEPPRPGGRSGGGAAARADRHVDRAFGGGPGGAALFRPAGRRRPARGGAAPVARAVSRLAAAPRSARPQRRRHRAAADLRPRRRSAVRCGPARHRRAAAARPDVRASPEAHRAHHSRRHPRAAPRGLRGEELRPGSAGRAGERAHPHLRRRRFHLAGGAGLRAERQAGSRVRRLRLRHPQLRRAGRARLEPPEGGAGARPDLRDAPVRPRRPEPRRGERVRRRAARHHPRRDLPRRRRREHDGAGRLARVSRRFRPQWHEPRRFDG